MRLYSLLTDRAKSPAASDLAFITWDSQATWSQLSERIESAKQWLTPVAGGRVAFRFCPNVGGFATLAALDFHQCNVFLLDEDYSAEATQQAVDNFQLNAVVTASSTSDPTAGSQLPISQSSASAASGVTILTSGTEGKPKAAQHTWESLARPVRTPANVDRRRWLLAFRPHLYAGLQVILQCFAEAGCLVVPRFGSDVSDIVSMMIDHKVQSVSATPSYWRRLVLNTDRDLWRKASVQQITLGGEIVDQQILNALAERFPEARIVHIYATTELGRCFAVSDQLAGFPVSLLDQPTSDGVELRVKDDQLCVKSANAMQHYVATSSQDRFEEGWWLTGDLVEITGDRVLFLGRAGDTINVGGNKVQPAQVENIIRQIPGVANAQVYGTPSSITGQLVACRIVCERETTEETIRKQLPAVTSSLSSFQRPRLYEFVDEIAIADSGKTTRPSRIEN